MATRFYLPISGTPPLGSLAVDSNWELTDNLTRLPCFTTKQNTALTQVSAVWSAVVTQQWCWRQWQSEPMAAAYNWTTADTVSMVIKCAESVAQVDSHLAYVIRVVSGDGSVIRGVIGLYHATSTEYPTSLATIATRIHSARVNGATNFSSQIGDRIIIEIGHHGVTPSLATVYHNYGDPSGTGDFALTEGLTTDLCPWVELSRTISFGSQSIEEASTLAVSNKTVVALSEVSDQDLTILAVSNKTIAALSETNEQDATTLTKNKDISLIDQTDEQDLVALDVYQDVTISEFKSVEETLYGA